MNDSASAPFEVSVQQVHQLRKAGHDFLLLDVREPDEYQTARIEGAVLLPMSEIAQRVDELEPHRERQVVVQCHHGGRSARVTEWLRQQGFSKAQNMAGGIDAWSQQIDSSVPRY